MTHFPVKQIRIGYRHIGYTPYSEQFACSIKNLPSFCRGFSAKTHLTFFFFSETKNTRKISGHIVTIKLNRPLQEKPPQMNWSGCQEENEVTIHRKMVFKYLVTSLGKVNFFFLPWILLISSCLASFLCNNATECCHTLLNASAKMFQPILFTFKMFYVHSLFLKAFSSNRIRKYTWR